MKQLSRDKTVVDLYSKILYEIRQSNFLHFHAVTGKMVK